MSELLGLAIFLVIGYAVADDIQCHRQWNRSEFNVSWGPIQGCLISRDGKTYIPADNYRDIK